jgi:hypothetical protein
MHQDDWHSLALDRLSLWALSPGNVQGLLLGGLPSDSKKESKYSRGTIEHDCNVQINLPCLPFRYPLWCVRFVGNRGTMHRSSPSGYLRTSRHLGIKSSHDIGKRTKV